MTLKEIVNDHGQCVATVTAIAGVLCVFWGIYWRSFIYNKAHPSIEHYGTRYLNYVIVTLWTLVPPIWFWLEWFYSNPNAPNFNAESFAHGHEVSRNIWVALVVVLVALFKIPWGGAG